MKFGVAVASLAIFAATPSQSFDNAEQAAAAGAKVCSLAATDFAAGKSLTAEALKKRFTDLGYPLDGKNLSDVDSSCGVMTMPGMSGAFAAMPILHLGINNHQGVAMTLKLGGAKGGCQATIVSLDGC